MGTADGFFRVAGVAALAGSVQRTIRQAVDREKMRILLSGEDIWPEDNETEQPPT